VDPVRFLEGRSYLSDGAVDIEVVDAAGHANGRYRLAVEAGSAAVRPTDSADVTLDVADLSALSLGGRSVAELAVAGRVEGSVDDLRRLDALLRWDRAPWCPEVF